MKKTLLSGLWMVVLVSMLASSFTSCARSSQDRKKSRLNKTQKGALIGAGAGAVVGGVVGRFSKNTAIGAILGATVGGAAGAIIGRKMDKQAKQLEKDLGKTAKVERVGEGIRVSMDGQLLFAYNSDEISAATRENLEKLAETLQKNPDTDLLVEGHTDNTGSADYNQDLSERRAASVSSFLRSRGVRASRLTIKGYGLTQPVADNSTEAGRRQNRRVEIAISANENMKRAARNGELTSAR
jgi:outer membrane protein OmpA-like peptidoglycan-associated protein